jgi:hypothetical protein
MFLLSFSDIVLPQSADERQECGFVLDEIQ